MHQKIYIWYYYRFLRLTTALYMKIGQHAFALLWSLTTGVLTGLAVVVIRGAALGLANTVPRWAIFALLGILLGKAVKLLLGDRSNTNADMTQLLQSIRMRRPGLIKLETFSHIIAAPITIGLGGSAGLATPSVLAGASIGGNIGRTLKVTTARRLSLMICGTAAGIAGIFNSPISGVLFAIELLLPRAAAAELVPVLLAAASSAVVSQAFFGTQSFFSMQSHAWELSAMPYYVLIGFFCAGVGIYMVRSNRWIGTLLERVGNQWLRLLVGGGAMALLIWIFPVVGGEGHDMMQTIFSGHAEQLIEGHWFSRFELEPGYLILFFALAAVLLKITASALTLDSGGAGGYFTPTLFSGAFAGLAFAYAANLVGWGHIYEANFIAAGMCGVFASAFRAPLTGIFLVNEMVGSNQLMLPLILVAAISFFTTMYLEQESIYGVLSKYVLIHPERTPEDGITLIRLLEVPKTIIRASAPPDWNKLLTSDPSEEFAVVDDGKILLGILRRSRIVPDKMDDLIKLLDPPTGVLSMRDSAKHARAACRIFSRDSLPVVDSRFRFRGFVTKTHLPPEQKEDAPQPATH